MHRVLAAIGLSVSMVVPSLAQAAPAPAAANLRLRDLPRGWVMLTNRTPTGAQLIASGGSRAFQMRLRGLIAADLETFDNRSVAGINFIESDVLSYRSRADAHADFRRAVTGPLTTSMQQLTIIGIDAECLGRTQVRQEQGFKERIDDLVFRDGAYIVLLRVAGFDGSFTTAQAVALGRVVDTRIKHAG